MQPIQKRLPICSPSRNDMQPIQKRYAAHPETFLMTRPAHPEMIANHTCNKDTPCCTPSRGGCARVTPWVHPPPLTSLRRTSLRKVAGWLSRPTQVLGVGTNGAVGRVFSRPEQPIQKRLQAISATRTPLAWLHPPPLTSLRSHFGSMQRSAKLRKISDARATLPHVSQYALSALIAKAKNGELPDTCHCADIRAARNLQNDITTPYGPLLTKDARVALNMRCGGGGW